MSDCNVSLSFPHGDERTACIKIEDEASGARVEVMLKMPDFALFITQLQGVPAELRSATNLDKWGKQCERKTVTLKDVPFGICHDPVQANALVEEHCPEGFIPSGYTNSQSGFVMHYKRWAE